jgi:hypothetical protein
MKIREKTLWIGLIAADIMVILLHLLVGGTSGFFHLDEEMNLPTFYSGTKLLFIGFFALNVMILEIEARRIRPRTKASIASWLPFALLFVYLGLDEIAQIHETIADGSEGWFDQLGWFSNHVFYWVVIFLPGIVAAIIFLGLFIARHFKNNAHFRWFYAGGLACFVMVVVLEFIGGLVAHADAERVYGVLTLVEEMFEFAGATLFMIGVIKSFRSVYYEVEQAIRGN